MAGNAPSAVVPFCWQKAGPCPEAVIHGGGKVGRVGLDSVVPCGVTILTAVVKRAGYRSPALPSLA